MSQSPHLVQRTTIEFRKASTETDGNDNPKTIGMLVGRAITFNRWSQDIGFREMILPSAVEEKMLKKMTANFDHLGGLGYLGRTENQTVRSHKSEDGVYVEIDLPNTQMGKDVAELAERGDLGGFSFEFRMGLEGEDRWEMEGDQLKRTIVRFGDVSAINPCINPAYSDSSVIAMRGKDALKEDTSAAAAIEKAKRQRELDRLKLGK